MPCAAHVHYFPSCVHHEPKLKVPLDVLHRHEFVVCMTHLKTNENFVYYEAVINYLRALYGPETAQKLGYFFLDIACQFQGYYDRC